MLAGHFHIQGLFAQAVTLAISAQRSAPVPAQQDTVLNLVQVLFHLFKKIVDAIGIFIPFPKLGQLQRGKIDNGFMNREIKFFRCLNKMFFP